MKESEWTREREKREKSNNKQEDKWHGGKIDQPQQKNAVVMYALPAGI